VGKLLIAVSMPKHYEEILAVVAVGGAPPSLDFPGFRLSQDRVIKRLELELKSLGDFFRYWTGSGISKSRTSGCGMRRFRIVET
jgi:hypothetical protein